MKQIKQFQLNYIKQGYFSNQLLNKNMTSIQGELKVEKSTLRYFQNFNIIFKINVTYGFFVEILPQPSYNNSSNKYYNHYI